MQIVQDVQGVQDVQDGILYLIYFLFSHVIVDDYKNDYIKYKEVIFILDTMDIMDKNQNTQFYLRIYKKSL